MSQTDLVISQIPMDALANEGGVAEMQEHMLHMPEEESHVIFLAAFLSLMLFFFVMESVNEKYKPGIGHQTGFTILLGMGVSYLFWIYFGTAQEEIFKFSHEAFFNFYLPPVIFNSGYNMRKKKFFQNLGNITIFGLFVTFTCFAIYSAATWFMIDSWDLTMTNYYALDHGIDVGPNPAPINVGIM